MSKLTERFEGAVSVVCIMLFLTVSATAAWYLPHGRQVHLEGISGDIAETYYRAESLGLVQICSGRCEGNDTYRAGPYRILPKGYVAVGGGEVVWTPEGGFVDKEPEGFAATFQQANALLKLRGGVTPTEVLARGERLQGQH